MDCAGPFITENGIFKVDFLQFLYPFFFFNQKKLEYIFKIYFLFKNSHSHGYNCQKHFNLCVMDPDTVIYASGCLIHIFDTKTGRLKFRKHQGVSHIAVSIFKFTFYTNFIH